MNVISRYKYWDVLSTMPEGWRIDETAGSPLAGHVFITDGKSVINGQKRALIKIKKGTQLMPPTDETPKPKPVKEAVIIDAVYVKTVNELARKKFEELLLKDIMVDLVICELEGWDKMEYIDEIKKLINGIESMDQR